MCKDKTLIAELTRYLSLEKLEQQAFQSVSIHPGTPLKLPLLKCFLWRSLCRHHSGWSAHLCTRSSRGEPQKEVYLLAALHSAVIHLLGCTVHFRCAGSSMGTLFQLLIYLA